MRFFNRVFGPPSEDKFARLMMRTLRQVGDQRQTTYDKAAFCLNFTENSNDAGMLNLRNLYIEYCDAAPNERAVLLRQNCISLAKRFEIPEDFEDAKHDLLVTVRPKSMPEVMKLDIEVRGATWTDVPAAPLSEHLITCLVYDLPTAIHFVPHDLLEKWGVSLYEAMEVGRQNLAQREFRLGQMDNGLFVFLTGDAFDASRMLLLDQIRSLDLTGAPVAMPVTRDSLLVTGAEDVEGLGLLAALAKETRNEARPVCPIPHKLVGDEWETWLPPTDHPHYNEFKLLETGYLFDEYAEQKSLLEKRHEQTGEDIFVATLSAAERDGEVLSYSLWSNGVLTWLPKTEFVGLYDTEPDQVDFVAWDRLLETVGYLMTPLECYPPRWLVDGFPTPEEIKRMRPQRWAE